MVTKVMSPGNTHQIFLSLNYMEKGNHEFDKDERRLFDQILQTEIKIIHAIRDETAIMYHMEDFYYISQLKGSSSKFECLKSNLKILKEETMARK
ncbi:hypothetical protein V6N13_104291 [Hibiscus sabdariffa]|uniref:Uncharacterized protein n=2 Tax=Hibiscus sabdariffa TaxID=183260 RepID=A0ABR1ZDH9_9ROSI